MNTDSTEKNINFLRGVPADKILADLIPQAADGYRRAIERYGTDVLQYGHFNGFKPLRELIGDVHRVDPERVVVGNGGMEIISLFLKALPPKSRILIEESTYDRVVLDAERYGHRLIGIRLNHTGADLDGLKSAADAHACQAFYGIPFHQNPTGINYTQENIAAVEKICRDRGMLCVWDICYEALRYDGETNSPIGVSDDGPVLINSFTKTIAPGTKCGYMVLPSRLVDDTVNVIANTRINPNLPTQGFIADFIASGNYDRFLTHICSFYRPRMDALNDALETQFAGAFPASLTGGFFSCLTFGGVTGEREQAFLDAARESGVGLAAAWNAVAPNLREDKRRQGLLVRLTFPAFEPEDIAWGISTLKAVAEQFR